MVLLAFFLPFSIVGYNIATPLAVIMVMITGHWAIKWNFIKSSAVFWLLMALLGLFFIGMFYSAGPWADRWYVFHKNLRLLYIPFLVMLMPNKMWRQYILNAYLVVCVLVALCVTYFSLVLHSGSPFVHFHNHIFGSFMLAVAAIIFLVRSFHAKYRWLYLTLFVFFSYVILFINIGRTGMLALIMGILFIVYRQVSYKKFIATVLLTVLLLASLGFGQIGAVGVQIRRSLTNLSNYYHHRQLNTSAAIHSAYTVRALKLLKDKPLFGHGTGAFRAVYKSAYNKPEAWQGDVGNPENTYVNIPVQLGLVGLFVYFALLLALYRSSSTLKQEGLEYQGMLIVFIFASPGDSFIQLSNGGFFFVLLCSLIISAKQQWTLNHER
jgi:O-antigen ligase